MKICNLLLVVACLSPCALLPARADVVTDWNTAAIDVIRAAKTPPPRASRALAILHAAIYDGVNGISRRSEVYLVPSGVPASASQEAAATVAAHDALVALFPSASAKFDAQQATTLAAIPNSPQKARGAAWGQFVAEQILAARAKDGADASVPPAEGTGPGYWIPTPPAFAAYLLPQWGFLKCFVMDSASQFRPP